MSDSKTMNQEFLKRILSNNFSFDAWKDLLCKIFPNVEYFSLEVPIDAALIKSGGQVGTIRLDDGRSLAIFKFEVADNIIIARNRRGLRDIAAKYVDQSLIHGALVLYYSSVQEDYRLTYVAKQTSFNSDGQLVKNETAPKRYTFLLGPNETCTTAANRLCELAENKRKNGSMYLADVTEAFSVERLNKEFFDGYKKQYSKFLATLTDTKQNRDYVKKLLGRIVFLHFLQKKGWMGVPASRSDWSDGDKNYLANLVDRYKGNERLLSDVLEPLFFKTLNEPRPGDLADPILGDNIKIPYLNGGLFDKDNIDRLDIDFPYDYFKNLMDFVSQYNFTIDENDPDDSEVGIDPEMLGHIFENLLEDNKDKGAFYTPKEIVQYMSRESVIQYLVEHTKGDLFLGHLGEQIADLINKQLVSIDLQDKSNAQRLYDLLANVKVCDPAIGSGAFPMGVLNVLYHTRHLLHAFAYPKKNFVAEEEKRDIIQNNIFGVDIEQGAVDIARLRFWLALVVDAEKPQPLPNLDYKIMQGNSLLEQFMGYDLSKLLPMTKNGNISKTALKSKKNDLQSAIVFEDEMASLEEIRRLMRIYFTTTSHALKSNLHKQIDTAIRQHIKICGGNTPNINAAVDNIDMTNKPFFLWHLYFADVFENGGFDIVIANPPYIEFKNYPIEEKAKLKCYITAKGKYDIYIPFIELGSNLLRQDGVLTYICPTRFLKRDYGKALRSYIVANLKLETVIDFTDTQIFENAITYTGIFIIKNTFAPAAYKFKYGFNLSCDYKQIESSKLNSEIWDFSYNDTYSLLNKIARDKPKLGDICDGIIQGIATGKDSVFLIREENIRQYGLERGLLRPFLKGKDISPYEINWKGLYVIYPYDKMGKVLPETFIKSSFPNVYSYLINHQEDLKGRGYFDRSTKCWYELWNQRNPSRFEGVKIVTLDNACRNSFAVDTNNYYGTTTVYNIKLLNSSLSPYYVVGVLNSKLLNYYHKSKSIPQANGFYRYQAIFIKDMPIILAEDVIQTRIERLVINMRNNKSAQNQIDQIVYHIYGLTYDEVLIVDPQTTITQKEYESFQL